MRHFLALAIISTVFLAGTCGRAQPSAVNVISQAEAHRHGLQRAWFTHASLDAVKDRLQYIVLDGPSLFVQSDKSVLEVLDAETGGRLWSAQVGGRDYPTSPVAANEKVLAVINGSTLYILDRNNGRFLREQRLRWIPSGTVALSPNWAYVPTLNSQLEVFGITDPTLKWNCGSAGYIDEPPLVGRRSLVWGTSKGYVNFANPGEGVVKFRLQTNGPVTAPMGYWPPLIMAASRDGYLYAIHEGSGETMWRFSLGTAVNRMPVCIGGSVYVTSEAGGLHCLACQDGEVRWFSPKATRVLAVTPTDVYATDRLNNTLVLDVKTGGHLDTFTTWQFPISYSNLQNDRLYYGSPTGILMCLRELPLIQPIQHLLPEEPKPAGKATGGEDMPMTPTDPNAPAQANPFGAPNQ